MSRSPAVDHCAEEGDGLDLGVVVEVIVVEDDAEGVDREVGGGRPADRRGEGARLVTHGRGRHHARVHPARRFALFKQKFFGVCKGQMLL